MIIIRSKVKLKKEQFLIAYDGLVEMAKTGVILLPDIFELLNEVPPDTEVVLVKERSH